MKHHFHFYFQNPIFDRDEQESEQNIEFLWEDELAVELNSAPRIEENAVFEIQGRKGPRRLKFSFPIEDCRVFHLEPTEGKTGMFVVTEDLIKNYQVEDKEGATHHHIEMGSLQEPHNPVPGIYISGYHFPEELDETPE